MNWLLKNRLFLINFVLVVFFAALGWGYLSRQEGKTSKFQLNGMLQRILEENQQLKIKISEAENKVTRLDSLIKEREQEIQTLSNAHAIKQALVNAQTAIAQLSGQIEQVRNEKAVLAENNIQINNRLQNVSSELIRSLEELKLARQKAADLKDNKAADNTNTIQTLQAEIDRLKAARISLEDRLTQKDAAIKEMEALNKSLKTQAGRAPADGPQRKELQTARQELERLKDELALYRSKAAALQGQLALSEKELLAAKDEIKKQSALNSARANLGLEQEYSKQRLEETQRLYENAKSQIAQLYEILASKEIELNGSKREAQDLRRQASELQARLSVIDNELKSASAGAEKAKSLEADKTTTEAKYLKAQDELQKQNEMVVILSSNINQLNKKILQKEEERNNLDRLVLKQSSEKASLEEELARQKKHIDEMNNFYGGLRSQIVQFSNLLTDKESELKQKEKELEGLRDEASRAAILERELQEAKERQRKIFENLAQAANLNIELQERLTGVGQSLVYGENNEREKKEAEDLKRKVEVILMPAE